MWYRFCYSCGHEWEAEWNPFAKCPKCRKKKWSTMSPRQKKAATELAKAKAKGIIKPQPCEVCGKKRGIHAHHEDYRKPLEVRWLCPKHHSARHAEMRRLGISNKRSKLTENRAF